MKKDEIVAHLNGVVGNINDLKDLLGKYN